MPAGTPEVPVAIVGAGACGLTAALALRRSGIDCVLLERDPAPRGSTALSSGFIPAAGTAVQRAAGIADSAERFAADIQAKAHRRAAPQLVPAYTAAIGPALDALQGHGLDWELLDGFLYPGHTARRMHTLAARTGSALVDALAAAADRAGAVTLTRAQVQQLWCDGSGRVIGAGFRRPDGSCEHLACRVLLLACNGFGGHAGLVAEFVPAIRDAIYAGHPGNDGSAVAWARALGLGLADLGAYQGHGGWAVPHGVLITWALVMQGGVQVNAGGERFHDETQGYSEAAEHVLAQPGGEAWTLVDDRLLALGREFPDFVAAEAAGAVRRAADTAALAALIGCATEPLARTLAVTPLRPPYGAIRVTGALFHTQGGIDVDARCRARYADGRPHPNLLAAGGAARGVSGTSAAGYLSGNGLLSAVAGGHIAARTAQEML
ncbi:MAG: FAD-dependent oxidoreductase [Rubrivivax sp.]